MKDNGNKKTLLMLLRSVLLLLVSSTTTILANPDGAGGCAGGQAAVGGYHLDDLNGARPVISADLALGEVSVTIDNSEPLVPDPNSPFTIQTQTDYTLTVTTQNDAGFKGILIRLEAPEGVETAGALEPIDSDLKIANVCEAPVVGVTHTSNSQKMSVSTRLRMDQAADRVNLDITGVGANFDQASVYGYNGFVLKVEGEAAPTTTSPTLPPGATFTPTNAPTVTDVIGTLSPTPSAAVHTRFGLVLMLAALISCAFL